MSILFKVVGGKGDGQRIDSGKNDSGEELWVLEWFNDENDYSLFVAKETIWYDSCILPFFFLISIEVIVDSTAVSIILYRYIMFLLFESFCVQKDNDWKSIYELYSFLFDYLIKWLAFCSIWSFIFIIYEGKESRGMWVLFWLVLSPYSSTSDQHPTNQKEYGNHDLFNDESSICIYC